MTFTASTVSASPWVLTSEDDLFSSRGTATLISLTNRGAGIHARCASGKVELSLIFEQKWDNILDDVPVDFVYRIDKSANVIRRAKFYKHNDNFIGVSIHYGYDAIVALDALSMAKKSILVGFDAGKDRASEPIPIKGSTVAIRRFWEECGIDAQKEIKTLARPAGVARNSQHPARAAQPDQPLTSSAPPSGSYASESLKRMDGSPWSSDVRK